MTSVDNANVLLIEPDVACDNCGCFVKIYHDRCYREAGIAELFIEDNYLQSVRDTVRGLHFQEPHAQGKSVMAVQGGVYDIVVDMRKGSPTFR